MRNPRALIGAVLAFALAMGVAPGSAQERPVPTYEPNFAGVLPLGEGTCTPETAYDMPDFYGDDCRRLHFAYGPILVKPGENDVLIEPTTIEQPRYDGYIVRWKTDLVDAIGQVPPVEEIHLHHGTWLNVTPSYGSGPFFASGEEKTILIMPENYGIHVQPTDAWLFLYMIHNATPGSRLVYVTWDIDFVAKDAADNRGFRNSRQIWLDVGAGNFHPQTSTHTANPIFNIQRGFGQADLLGYTGQFGFDEDATFDPGGHDPDGVAQARLADLGVTPTGVGNVSCRFPDQNCSRFNTRNYASAQQGIDVTSAVRGKDLTIGNAALGDGVNEGTLIVMGGHLHPGGVRTEVSLVRDGEERLIHLSDALYWDWDDPDRVGAPPQSWDFSMTGSILDMGWAVNVKRGDVLRLNGVYDTSYASWYDQMGIVMTWVVPGGIDEGIDVFAKDTNGDYIVELDTGFPDTILLPEPLEATCTPSPTTLCLRGQVTRPSEAARQGHTVEPPGGWTPLPTDANGNPLAGPVIDEIPIAGFSYGPAELGLTYTTGIPQVLVNQPLRAVNYDTAAYMWHTVTRCQEPCTGPTAANNPIADGGDPAYLPFDDMNFDSSELGIGLAPSQRIEWEFTPTRTGVYSFFCRIHPGMRGAIMVVDEPQPWWVTEPITALLP